jgi:flavin reductase (DIM6/NTAB) family NADH-FMN oxidoreductase RutF
VSDDFDTIVRRFDTPMVVVTTAAGDKRSGCVVGFHVQCSIEPVRYAVWLSKANLTYRVALFATHLAVHALAEGDDDIAALFGGATGDEVDKFARCEWTGGPGGVPLLAACPNRIVLARTSLWDDGGDHVCVVGTPVEAHAVGELTPLRLRAVSRLDPGHAADERPTPAQLRR